ncbi:MAG TPA: UvrB/UvrC motif-containing protein [Bacteroidia bacterium]|jgi:protein-arginine kinase activator protein McsA|nr:UvrB/UvrC motif-containing protein [Bacteroidia bacterium]
MTKTENRIEQLKYFINAAVKNEQYEEAAIFRDEIFRLMKKELESKKPEKPRNESNG